MAKEKSSVVLTKALEMIENGTWRFVCAAILDIESDVIPKQRSQAMNRFLKFKPKEIRDDVKMMSEWWPRTEKAPRIEALKKCIERALKEND